MDRWVCIAWEWTLPLSTLVLHRVGMDLTVINAVFALRENGLLGMYRVRMDFTKINAGFASRENGPYNNQHWVCIAREWTLTLSTLVLDRVGMDLNVNYVHTVDYKTACISYFFLTFISLIVL